MSEETIEDLLNALHGKGVKVSLHGGNLKLEAKPGILDPLLIQSLRARKKAMVDHLQASGTPEIAWQEPHDTEGELLPLSPAQSQLWFLDKLNRSNTSYSMPALFHLAGQLDIPALEGCLRSLVDRHPILRANFEERDGDPWQRIDRQKNPRLSIKDLTAYPKPAALSEMRASVSRSLKEKISLSRDWLIQAELFILGPSEYSLFLRLHHIVADGISVKIMLEEVSRQYNAPRNAEIPSPRSHYRDFVFWQNSMARTEHFRKGLSYWEKSLANNDPIVFDKPAGADQGAEKWFRKRFMLDEGTVKGLQDYSRRHGTSLYMTLFSIYFVLLHRLSGRPGISVGMPASNRRNPEFADTVGLLINTLVIRMEVRPEQSFQALLETLRAKVLEALEYQDIPFDSIVRARRFERDARANPLFQVLFSFQDFGGFRLNLDGVEANRESLENPEGKFDLSLDVELANGILNGMIECKENAVPRGIAESIASGFPELAQAIHSSDRTVSELSDRVLPGTGDGSSIPRASACLEYWKTELKDAPVAHTLPVLSDPSIGPRENGSAEVPIPDAILRMANGIRHEYQIELRDIFTAALALLLAKYGNARDITFGVRELRSLKGFGGYLPGIGCAWWLRSRGMAGMPFSQLVRDARNRRLGAYRSDLMPEPGPTHKELKSAIEGAERITLTLFGLEGSGPATEDVAPGLSVDSDRHDLDVQIGFSATGVRVSIICNASKFEASLADRMANSFVKILNDAVSSPEKEFEGISPIDPEDYRRISELNDVRKSYPVDQCIHQLFESQVGKNPDSTAVVLGSRRLSYREISIKSESVANELRKIGVRPNQLVGLCYPRCPEMLAALIGILKAGGAYIPMDPAYPADRLRFMVSDSEAKVVLTIPEYEPIFRDLGAQVIAETYRWPVHEPVSPLPPDASAKPSDLAYVIYTSGSTGNPKGAAIEHRSIVNYTYGIFDYLNGTRPDFAFFTSISFDLSVTSYFTPLLFGGTVTLIEETNVADMLKAAFGDPRVRAVKMTPSHLQLLANLGDLDSSVECLVIGGEALSARLCEQITELFRGKIRILNEYGPTETTVGCTIYAYESGRASGGFLPIGKPMPNTSVRVLDRELNLAPIGMKGELYVSGSGLARGYLRRPDLTRERFIRNRGVEMYRTGDLAAYESDGTIIFFGREDGQLKIRGNRVELGEIENQLIKLPWIREAIVLHERPDDSHDILTAYLVPDSQSLPDKAGDEDLIQRTKVELEKALPPYMRPARFILMSAFPLTKNGKVDREALPKPEPLAVNDELPGNDLRSEILSIWKNVLSLPAVGMDDDFFGVGGHSLLALRLLAKLQKRFHIDLQIGDLFKHTTINGQTRLVSRARDLAFRRIEKADRKENIPLSFSQQRLWFLDQLDRNSTAYHIPFVLEVRGNLDCKAMETAFIATIRRHESLRTVIEETDAGPRQRVLEDFDFSFSEFSIGESTGHMGTEEVVEKYIAPGFHAPFDLSRDLNLRARWYRKADGLFIVFGCVHHIAADGWSIGVLQKDVSDAYNAILANRDPFPEPLRVQYSDFSIWQRRRQSENAFKGQKDFWLAILKDIPKLHQLPLDMKRPAIESHTGDVLQRSIEASAFKKIAELCGRYDCTLFVFMASVFSVLIGKLSREDTVILGTPVAGRQHDDLEDMVGFFVNTLVYKTDLKGNQEFVEVLRKVKEYSERAIENQAVPFEMLVEELKIERSLSHSPLFQIMINVIRRRKEDALIAFEGLDHADVAIKNTTSMFDLTFTVIEKEDRLSLEWNYNTALFKESSIATLHERFSLLLDAVLREPGRRIAEYPIVIKAEIESFAGWNRTERFFPRDKQLHHLFEMQARSRPGAVAIRYRDEIATYKQLDILSDRVAIGLLRLGVGRGDTVGICMDRTIQMVSAIFGILKAGGAFIPFDPGYPIKRLDFMRTDSNAKLIVCDPAYASLYEQGISIRFDELEGLADRDVQAPPSCAAEGEPEDLARIIYTSGSTGEPKGVKVTHSNILALLDWVKETYSAEELELVLASTSLNFDVSTFEIFGPLCLGYSIQLVDSIISLVEEKMLEPTMVGMVPSAIHGVLGDIPWPGTVRVVNFAGEPLSKDAVNSVFERTTAAKVYNLYGPTEDTTFSTWDCYTGHLDSEPTIGRPLTNTKAYVLDPSMNFVPICAPGELYLSGCGITAGYLGKPELTAARFLANPFGSGQDRVFYKTGDLARWLPDGRLDFQGRIDHQVKVRGYRIELGEIENSIRRCPAVSEAIVVNQSAVQGGDALTAYMVLKPETRKRSDEETVAQVVAYLREYLPEYMIPFHFEILPRFPLTPNGKLDRNALPRIRYARETVVSQPQGPIETQLYHLWKDILGREDFGTEDEFFSLGGHSLTALGLLGRVRKKFGIGIMLKDIFIYPTIKSQAGFIASSAPDSPRAIPKASGSQQIPASPSQKGLWLVQELQKHVSYHIPFCFAIHGPFRPDVMEAALRFLLERHKSLRTVILNKPEGPIQAVLDADSFSVKTFEIGPGAGSDPSEIKKLANDFVQNPFDLSKDYMIRAGIVAEGDGKTWLFGCVHHIACDGWSMSILLRELGMAYNSFQAGIPVPIVPLPIEYSDYSIWKHRQMGKPGFQDQIGYWKRKLDGAPLRHRLEHVSGSRLRVSKGEVTGRISDDLFSRLSRVGQQAGCTDFMVIAAVFSLVLSRFSGEKDVVFGSPTAGREHEDLENLVGLFVNTLAYRFEVDEKATFLDHLGRVRDVCIEASANQSVPFEKIVQELGFDREVESNPLCQIMLVLNDARREVRIPELRDAEIQPVQLAPARTNFDLVLVATENHDGIELQWVFDDGLFGKGFIERLNTGFHLLMERVLAEPGSPLFHSGCLTEQEVLRLSELSGKRTENARLPLVPTSFARAVKDHPGKIALCHGDIRIPYMELDRRSEALARRLRREGVRRGVLVGLHLEASIEFFVAVLGVLKAGGAYVPLDPQAPAERVKYMMKDAGLNIVLVTEEPRFDMAVGRVLKLDQGAFPEADVGEDLAVREDISSRDLAYVIYTSGTTGNPKGVAIGHGSLSNLVLQQCREFGIDSSSNVLQFASATFDASVSEWGTALCTGAQLTIARKEEILSPRFGKHPDYLSITHATFPPALLPYLKGTRWESVPNVIVAGENTPLPVAQEWARGRTLFNAYGPTENTVCATIAKFDAGLDRVHIGRPIGGVLCFVVGSQLELLPLGVPGELILGGEGLAKGYLGREDLSKEKFFLTDAYTGIEERFYRTGDKVKWLPDGNLEFLGRLDDQIKIRGIRIEPAEIEYHLLRIEEVREAVVQADFREDNSKALTAYVVLSRNDDGTGEAENRIRSALSRSLPDFMIPGEFIFLEKLPLSPNLKVDRKALPAPSASGPRTVEEPRTPMEKKMAEVWIAELKVREVGRDGNFFRLGGDSLRALNLCARIEEEFGVTIHASSIFNNPSLETLSAYVEKLSQFNDGNGSGLSKPIEQGQRPLFMIPGLGSTGSIFSGLAPVLGEAFEVRFLEPIAHVESAGDPLQAMARSLASELAHSADRNTVHILGHSLGGWLAYEIAELLESRGIEVRLILLDCHILADSGMENLSSAEILEKIASAAGIRPDEIYPALRASMERKIEFQKEWKFAPKRSLEREIVHFVSEETLRGPDWQSSLTRWLERNPGMKVIPCGGGHLSMLMGDDAGNLGRLILEKIA